MNSNKNIPQYLMYLSLAGLTSCGITREYKQVSLDTPENFRAADTLSAKSDSSTIADLPYREFFKDKKLLELIDNGIAKNYNLSIAIKQVEFAEQSLKQAKWGNIPTISGTIGSASIQRPSDNSMNGSMIPQFLGKSYITDFGTNVQIGWEADIWGKIKNRKSAALADYLQTEEAQKAVQTKLVASIAQGYYNLLMLDKQLEITKNSIRLFEENLKLTGFLRDAGDVTTLAVQQQQASLEAAKASIPALEKNIAVQENALNILTGENPQSIKRENSLDEIALQEDLPASFPSALLANRPDVKQAELSVRRSVALENVAHTSMYPSLSISAQGGLNAVDFSNWFSIPGSLFGSLAGNLTTPILQGRQLKTQYEQAKITTEQAELSFKQTLLTAVGEVSDALIEIDKLKPQKSHTKAQVDTLNDAIKNAKLLYAQGMSNYLEVLTAQNNKLQAELNLASLETQSLNAVVVLYRSLGGGWK